MAAGSPTLALRAAVAALPRRTREAMLAAIEGERAILTGAHADDRGGVCPVVGAHRRGARIPARDFALAWDRFTGVRPGRARRATRREVAVLRAQLVASLLDDEGADLAAAIADHQALARARRAREAAEVGREWLDASARRPPGRAPA
jgi:hypothetical protein